MDDEPEVCDIIREYRAFRGYDVLTALDGPTAIQMVKEFRPSVVLLDIVMPGMSGLEVLVEIKAFDPSIHVIILTGIGDQNTAGKAIEAGASEYLTKPFVLSYLDETVKRFFEKI